MKRLVLATSVVAILSAAPAQAGQRLTGRYKAKVTSSALHGEVRGTWILTFRHGYFIAVRNGRSFGREPFSVAGTRFTVKPAGACPGSGTYSFKLSGRKLKFRLLKDACTPRRILLSYTFTKIG